MERKGKGMESSLKKKEVDIGFLVFIAVITFWAAILLRVTVVRDSLHQEHYAQFLSQQAAGQRRYVVPVNGTVTLPGGWPLIYRGEVDDGFFSLESRAGKTVFAGGGGLTGTFKGTFEGEAGPRGIAYGGPFNLRPQLGIPVVITVIAAEYDRIVFTAK